MEDKSGTAFPVEGMGILGLPIVKELGLTKRELFAAMAMQGVLASPNPQAPTNSKDVAESALLFADALLAALEAKEGE